MQHYSHGMRSEKSLEKAKPKSVNTDQAFEALKGML
jgi:hypothetical protein